MDHADLVKGIVICLLISSILVSLYCLAVCFVMAVCWVTGLPPAHLLPGMTPYNEWRLR